MKTIIAGTRVGVTLADVDLAMERSLYTVTEVVSGHSGAADFAGEAWARKRGIPIKLFPADWKEYGKNAGPIRNERMAEYADALVALWDGQSRGTANMIQNAKRYGLMILTHRIRSQN